MRFTHLSLRNFRNYQLLNLDLPQGVILLQGDNAQGKTNFLEAIYYLATGSSPRTDKDAELMRWGAFEEEEIAAVRGQTIGQNQTGLEILLLPQPEGEGVVRQIKIEGMKKRQADLWGLVPVVLFLPQDVDLAAGPPYLRRRFLDGAISQIDRGYFRAAQEYERVLAQRNHLLKRLRGGYGQRPELTFWDEKLSEVGSRIQETRAKFIAELEAMAKPIHHDLSGGERLRLVYRAGGLEEAAPAQIAVEIAEPLATQRIEDRIRTAIFRQRLESLYSAELERGVTLFGPHRDELLLLADDVDLNLYGSRGQQRTAALSLKLAQARHLRQKKEEEPILLLDDVASELDEFRRNYLLRAVASQEQLFITTTELKVFPADFLARATSYRVVQGTLSPI